MMALGHNKVCELEDFAHAELVANLRELYAHRVPEPVTAPPWRRPDRHDWAAGMTLRSLRSFGGIHPDAQLLAVCAGASDVVFHVSRHVRQVVGIDRYLDDGGSEWAPFWMLVHPEQLAPFPIDTGRMVTQHMDPRQLRFPDGSFDAVFCGRALEFTSLAGAANVAYEIGRVLRPGGVACLTIDLLLAGPQGATGWPAELALPAAGVEQFLVDASGLHPVDGIKYEPSQQTLASPREIGFDRIDAPDPNDLLPVPAGHPALIRVSNGCVITCAHLTLMKTEDHPRLPNVWAQPSPTTMVQVGEDDRDRVCR